MILRLLLLAALSPVVFGQAQAAASFDELKPCELSAGGGQLTVNALCGSLQVPEDPQQPQGRQLELAYAVVTARGPRKQPDPVFFLAGGPGQSARDIAPIMRMALRDINRQRDLIFLDQRGTGGSNPLECVFDDEEQAWLDPSQDEFIEQLFRCKRDWDADVRFYTSAHAARDLDALRQHYGFEQINLIGGSYGTRMAQVYLRLFPDRVRSVILDAVVPTRLHLGAEHGLKLDLALNRLIDACVADAECNATFPDLRDAFGTLLASFPDHDDGPTMAVTHPRKGSAIDMRFTRTTLGTALRFLSYGPQSQMMIPYLIHEAANTGNPARIASQAMIVTDQLADAIATGLNFAVGCSEDWPGWPDVPGSEDTLLGNTMREYYDAICVDWPLGEVADDFHQPFDSEVPVLILSGELDPVTPPEYGEEAHAQFSNSLHLIARGRGHIVLTHRCVSGIAAQFVASASVEDLDTECMEQLGAEPFFLNLLGPAP